MVGWCPMGMPEGKGVGIKKQVEIGAVKVNEQWVKLNQKARTLNW
jgi:hypothetical protein